MSSTSTLVFFGLGNPETCRQNTFHNVGFWFLNYLAEKYQFPEFQNQGKFSMSSKEIFGYNLYLIKPMTGMNSAGEVAEACKQQNYIFENTETIVIYDDLDLELGDYRIGRWRGGSHNGLRSLFSYIGRDFLRIRIGNLWKKKPSEGISVYDFVLSDLSQSTSRFIKIQFPELEEKVLSVNLFS